MKRLLILFAILILAALIWGGLLLSERQQHLWIAAARRDELEKYVKDHPDQPEALVRLSGLLRNAGERAEAEKLARHAIEITPNEDACWVQFSLDVTDDGEAIRGLTGFLKVKPDSTLVRAELARRYLQTGDVMTARTLAEKAMKLSPASPDAWRVHGEVMAGLHQAPEAENDLRKALSLHDDTDTRLLLARTLIPLQRYAEIIDICSPIVKAGRSLDVSPEQRARALLYTAGGRLYDPLAPEEIAALQTQLREADALSAQLTPEERFLPPYFLGESFLRLGRPKEAIPFLERSVAAGPMFAGSLYSLARAYRVAGDTAKANEANARHARLSRILGELDMYNNRLEQRPEDAETMWRLANVLTEAGNVVDAAQIYRHLIAQGKYMDAARQKLNALPLPH